MSIRFIGRLIALFALISVLAVGSFGDEVYARIRGIVTDPSGAALSGVNVTATNGTTGLQRTATTQSNGSYEFVNLPIGTYTVKVSAPSFKTYQSTQIPLAVNQIYNLPVQMTVGAVSETVEVKADTVQVETTSNQLQTLVTGKEITDLPLIGRNWTSLEQLVPGVVAASDRFGTFAVNGSQSTQSSFLINGVDANDLPLNTPLIIPSPDALGEFNLITNTINPEYGRNSGGIVNAVIKNGTNSFHGDVFEFYRDTFLNTHNFFQKKAPVFHQNLFGGTVGGPIWRDKTFFFLSYQGNRNRQPEPGSSNIVTVFTPGQRGGDFSAGAAGCPFGTKVSPFPLMGESGAVFAAGTPYCTIFPTGHIPTSDFNPISANLLAKFVPSPNFGANQFSFNPTRTSTQDQGIARIDHTLSPSDSLWGVAFLNHAPNSEDLPFTGATLPGFGDAQKSDSKQFTADWNHTFNPNTLNEFRLGYTRLNLVTVSPITPVAPSTLGFAINPQLASGQSIPRIAVTGLFTLGFSINGPQPRIDQTYEVTDNFTKIVGRHSLKFGFDGRRFDVNNPFSSRNNGSFSFATSATNSTGIAGADFLLGIPSSYNQQAGGIIIARAYESYTYAQDSWKVLPNLTVNYGTGWQIDTPLNNYQFGGHAVNCFRPGQQSTVFPTAPLDLVYPGDPTCNNAGGYNTKWDHFGPRAGFVYAPNLGFLSGGQSSKLSIRAGWGLYFNRTEEEGSLQNLGAPPFGLGSSGASDVGGRPSFANPFTDISGNAAKSEPNKFPFAPPPLGSAVDFSPFEPFSINVIAPNLTTPYAMNYNLTIQRELPANTVLSLGYVGSQGRHLLRSFEGNSVTLAGAAQCAADPACASDPFFKSSNPTLSPFPGDIYEGLGTQATTGKSNYNAFQASLNKGLTHGLTFQLGYTWSHSIDDGSGLEDSGFNLRGSNVLIPGLNLGDSSFDARHRFVASYSYQVPNLHRNLSLLPSVIFGGWQLTGITTLQTGFPITLGDSGFTSLTCDANTFYACPDNPNQIGPIRILDPRTSSIGGVNHLYFDPSSFAPAAPGTFGNVRRNSFHGPGLNNTDFAIFKNTPIGSSETRYIQLRLEGYNVFNHTQFCTATSCADGDIQDAGSGGTFGQISAAQPARLIQLAAKFYF
jgi:hypothetical protein